LIAYLIDAGAKVRPAKRPGGRRPQYPGSHSTSSSDSSHSDANLRYLGECFCAAPVCSLVD